LSVVNRDCWFSYTLQVFIGFLSSERHRCDEVSLVCVVDLQGQLTQAEQHAAQYKSIADSVESSLREQTAASEQFRQTLEARVAETLQGTYLLLLPFDLCLTNLTF